MRKLMWFAVGFAICCALCAYGMNRAWMLPLAGAALFVAAVCILAGRDRKLPKVCGAVLLGCILGMGWFGLYHAMYLKPVEALEDRQMYLDITGLDYSYETDYGFAVDGLLSFEGRDYQTRLYLGEEMTISPGDRISGSFRLRLTTPQAGKASRYFQAEGIFLLCYPQEDIVVKEAEKMPWQCYPALLRRQLRDTLQETFGEDVRPFAQALLLGDATELDYATDTALKVSGIRHIAAVSGLHISILYSLVAFLTLRRRYLTALAGIPVLLLFAAVAGFTPSVTRACIMLILMLLAMVFDREYDPPTALASAVMVMLLINPLVVTSVSLQLSAGCVAGILLFQNPVSGWLSTWLDKLRLPEKMKRVICGSVSVSLSSMSLVAPLSAGYFGVVSLVGVVTNLLTLWVVSGLFCGIAAVCLLNPVIPAAAKLLAMVLSWPARYVLWVADALASASLAAVYADSIYIAAWLVFCYLLLAFFLLSKNRQPEVLLCCGVLGLCFALLASWGETASVDTRITMLDVGQGQSILLESEGKAFLVDCGGENGEDTADAVAAALLSRGIYRLDAIILTHYDMDHSNALSHLLTRVETELLFLPDTRNDFPVPEGAWKTLYVWEDLQLVFGKANLKIYGPVYSGYDNENSLCVLFDTENCDILITGDRSGFGERMLLRRRDLPDVDILVAGHHGAETSTSEALLSKVQPELVLISVGRDNIYGHPAPELLHRLTDYGCRVLRTDELGTITIRR